MEMYKIKDTNRIGLPLVLLIRDYILSVLPIKHGDILVSQDQSCIVLYTNWFLLRISYPIDGCSVYITCSSLDEHLGNHYCMVSLFMPFVIEALKINVFGYVKNTKDILHGKD